MRCCGTFKTRKLFQKLFKTENLPFALIDQMSLLESNSTKLRNKLVKVKQIVFLTAFCVSLFLPPWQNFN